MAVGRSVNSLAIRPSILGALACLFVGLVPVSSEAQVTGRAARVGILSAGPPPGRAGVAPFPPFEAFVKGLRDLGWIEGENVVFESRWAGGKAEQLPRLARELAGLPIDVLVTFATAPILAARAATTTIPIVMIAGGADPVADGLAKSLARPGGNVTGLTWAPSPELIGKNLEILREIIPTLSRVGFLSDAPASGPYARAREEAAGRLRLATQVVVIRDLDEIEAALAAFHRQRVDAVFVGMVGANYAYRYQLTARAAQLRIPTLGLLDELPRAGGLLSYGPSLTGLYRRGATYLDKVLRGANVATLPIEQPSKYELVLNSRTAKALGLVIPPSLLLWVDQAIE
jgi:putative ABC transport system substrate-binding protein